MIAAMDSKDSFPSLLCSMRSAVNSPLYLNCQYSPLGTLTLILVVGELALEGQVPPLLT